MSTEVKQINRILCEVRSVQGVESVAVVSREGHLVTYESSALRNARSCGALAATLLGAAETSLSQVGITDLDRIIIESRENQIVVMGAGPKALILASLHGKSSLGLALISLEKAARRIEDLV